MNPALRTLSLLLLLITSACATIVEGPSQKITVSSAPQGAQCLIKQADDIVGRVTTPGTAEVSKSKNDLVIFCSKPGYESVSVKNRSDLAIASLGNAAFYELSFLGNAVDSATGASNKYDSKVFVRLTPAAAPAVFPAPPGAPPIVQLPVQSVASMTMQVPMPTGMVAATAAPVAPVVASALSTPVLSAPGQATTLSNPSLHAASSLGDAALKIAVQQQPPRLTYAQATAESLRRPPFEIEQ